MRVERWSWILGGLLLAAMDAGCSEGGASEGQALTRTDPASAAQCPQGGLAESFGRDDNGNGVLDDGEIERTEVACDPLRLARTVAEAEGAHCVAGGTALQAGPDRDGDGVLDDEEVDETTYQCSTIMGHDVSIATAEEAAALAEITEVHGDLKIGSPLESGIVEVSLPRLRKVTGDLAFGRDLQLKVAAFPELTDVEGDLEIGGDFSASRLHTLSLPKLVRVGGSFSIVRSPSLVNMNGVPLLERVGGDFRLENCSALTAMRGPLHGVGGKVRIASNAELEKAVLRLDEPTLDVEVSSNRKLREASLKVPGAPSIKIANNDVLTKLDLSDLDFLPPAGALGAISITDHPLLERIEIAAGRVGSVKLAGNPSATQTTIVADELTGSLEIREAAGVLSLQRRSSSTSAFVIGGSVTLRGPLQLATWAQLRVEGDLLLEGGQMQSLRNLERVGGGLRLLANPLLASVDPISFVGGQVEVYDNDSLVALDFVAQQEIFGTLHIGSNQKLEQAQGLLANLQRVHGGMLIVSNPKLATISSPVSELDGSLTIHSNYAITRLQLDQLTRSSRVSVFSMYGMTELSLPALQTTGSILVQLNTSVQRLLLPALQTATSLRAVVNSALPTCQLQALCARLSLTGAACELSENSPGGPCP
jgi:hypothetical protein